MATHLINLSSGNQSLSVIYSIVDSAIISLSYFMKYNNIHSQLTGIAGSGDPQLFLHILSSLGQN